MKCPDSRSGILIEAACAGAGAAGSASGSPRLTFFHGRVTNITPVVDRCSRAAKIESAAYIIRGEHALDSNRVLGGNGDDPGGLPDGDCTGPEGQIETAQEAVSGCGQAVA